MSTPELPPQQWICVAPTPDGRLISLASEESVEARERVLFGRIAELEAVAWPERLTPAMRDALRTGSRRDCPSDELCDVRYAALRAARGAK